MRQLRTITLAELLEVVQNAIQDHGEEMGVVFTASYGDYHDTPQALPFEGEYELRNVVESGYSRSDFAILESDDDEEDADAVDTMQKVIVIR